MEHPYGKQYGQEGNPRAYMTMRDYRNLPYQWQNQQPVGRNPNPNMSLREYRDKYMSAPVYHVPSTYPPPPQYDHPEPRPREDEGQRYSSYQGESINTISEKTLMREKLTILTRRLDEMEMKHQHNIYSVNELSASQPSYCNHQSYGHYGENCQGNVQILNQGRPPLNVPFGNSYIQNWKNHSNLPGKPCIPPTDQQQFTPTSQQQQPISLSPVEQAVLKLSKVVDTIAKEQKVHLSNMQDEISKLSNQLLQSSEKAKGPFQGQQYQTMVNEIGLTGDTTTRTDEVKAVVTLRSGREIETVKSSLNKRTDGLQSEIDQKLDIQQESILKLVPQFVHQEKKNLEEESQEEECLTGTILGEQVQLQPQEELEVESLEAPEALQEASVNFWPWTKEKEITALLTEKSSEHEGTQEPIIQPNPQPNPINLDTLTTAQDTKTPLPAAPPESVYILPTPAQKSKPSAPAPKGKSNTSLHAMQNIRRLVASVHTFATTSKKMANAYIAWHSGWFGCGFGAPGPRHF